MTTTTSDRNPNPWGIVAPLTISDVMEITGRSRNHINSAANTGALEGLPRENRPKVKHFFRPKHVQDWIDRGMPSMPHKPGRKHGAASPSPTRRATPRTPLSPTALRCRCVSGSRPSEAPSRPSPTIRPARWPP
ncbi:hypothetical protein [Gordonia sp. FQ]|uniref:hypothetical protein n=1 Tax=Gordonia sp. FQ TaxID=3446634 RepID=UPI003F868123